MTGRWWHHERLRNGAGYALTAALSVALLARFLHLWNADLTVPLYYNGDSIFTAMQVRTVLDHGWYLKNPRVGMPQGGEMYDFPLPETVHFALLKLLGLCGCNCIVAINLYYLLSYPLTALTSYLVLRHFGCGRLGALVASLLFAFIPYHFYRSIRHLFLACYYLVPLMVMVVLWVYGEPGLLFSRREGEERMRLTPFSWRVLAGVVVCLLSASAGAYYAFFTCFFLAVAGLFRAAT
ncbi:MAG: hypothetical protein E6K70_01290, partial [Planctomycetota bacterium]